MGAVANAVQDLEHRLATAERKLDDAALFARSEWERGVRDGEIKQSILNRAAHEDYLSNWKCPDCKARDEKQRKRKGKK